MWFFDLTSVPITKGFIPLYTTHRADDLTSDLILSGFDVQSIHGDREQADREQALEDFKEGELVLAVQVVRYLHKSRESAAFCSPSG